MESIYDMVSRIQEKYPVLSGEVVEDIAREVLAGSGSGSCATLRTQSDGTSATPSSAPPPDSLPRQDAAQIALLRGVQQLRQAEKDGAPVTYCAGVQATYQAIVNALMTEGK